VTTISLPSQPPLSIAAEELLDALAESVSSARVAPWDPVHWIFALIEDHAEALVSIANPTLLGAIHTAIQEREGDVGSAETLGRIEVAALAGEFAKKDGRPVISAQDIVVAVLSLVVERLRKPSTQSRSEVADDVPAGEAVGGPVHDEVPTRGAHLPMSGAAEEMLDGLCAHLSLETVGSAGVFRWLDVLLLHHEVQVDGDQGDDKLQRLRDWGLAREKAGDPVLVLAEKLVRDEASQTAREYGHPAVDPQDLAIAIVKLAVRAFREAGEQSGTSTPPPQAAPDAAEHPTAEYPPVDTAEVPSPGQAVPDPEPQEWEEVSGVTAPAESPAHARTRTFRLFVSSTFQDLRAERNALQQVAFPRLKDFCARHGARFQAIDLRWGVSEEAGFDQQTMNICLGEIRRCHKVTPRPNFLVLLGDRYGWLPPPPQIPAREFEDILESVENPDQRRRLERWYQKDLNADPPEYRLRPRSGEREGFRDWAVWNPEEEIIRQTLDRATGKEGLDLPPSRRKIYRASATEQEILAGALDVSEPEDKVFCVFRRIQGYPMGEEGSPLSGADTFVSLDPQDREKLQRLKLRLVDRLPGACILSQSVVWGDQGPKLTDDYLAHVANWVAESLEGAILQEISRSAEASLPHVRAPEKLDSDPALLIEVGEHLAFAAERRRHFVGREDALREIAEYIRGEGAVPLAIVGDGGTGKSALMAEATRRIEEAGSDRVTVVRFVGATPGSSEGRFLLESLCREIPMRYGVSPEDVPADYQELVSKLADQFKLARSDRPLVLLVDSLDQLSEPASGLSWIPSPLPPHVRLVVSTRTGAERDRLEDRGADFLYLGPLSREDGRLLLEAWLLASSPPRRLQPDQTKVVLDAFVASGGNPLHLRLATEEARRWPAWARVGETTPTAIPSTPLAVGVREVIRENLLGRLADKDNHGSVLVSRAMGYLVASRYGLAEDEIIDLLSRDPDVYTWFLQETMHLPQDLVDRAAAHWSGSVSGSQEELSGSDRWKDTAAARLNELRHNPERLRAFLTDELGLEGLQLPVVLWSRLSFDLEPYLTERRAEGGNLLSFFHREIGDVAAEQFLNDSAKDEIHGRLADYFRSRADPGGTARWDGEGPRGLSELPYHLTQAGRWEEVFGILTDFSFLEQKAARVGIVERTGSNGRRETLYTGVYQLQDDFDRALRLMPDSAAVRSDVHPLIVTAVDFGSGLVVRCPWCNTTHPLIREWLGKELHCPNPDCQGPLKVNRFTVGQCAPE